MFFELTESLWNEGHKGRPFKLEERDRARLCDKDEMLKERDHERERERDRERERTDKGVSCISKDVAAHRNSLPINKEKYNWNKPISELDLSNCQRCTPSYRLLPKNVIIVLFLQSMFGQRAQFKFPPFDYLWFLFPCSIHYLLQVTELSLAPLYWMISGCQWLWGARIIPSSTCAKTNLRKACLDVKMIGTFFVICNNWKSLLSNSWVLLFFFNFLCMFSLLQDNS